jgi:RNA polymerase sigma-70 factor (ECF subfamily)
VIGCGAHDATVERVPPLEPDSSDAEIARAVQRGDGPQAEAELVRRFSRRVVLFGLRHLGDEAQAHDLAQDVMLTVLQKLRAGDVREPERIGSFVLGTARWMAHDMRRRARRSAEVVAEAAMESPTIEPAPEPLDLDVLERALGQLPERERAVVVLSLQQERTAAEIADAFGLKAGHVRVIRHRAIARLAELMGGTP